ncbi:RmlC-like cupin domain-containing protein [Pseudomassariella vexata]|uniref:Mannose-6-phosphate isomerase n=1 Tax=Pseudomassariella vexata TaxID=1141098 RepID=A0A1Y2DP16_9PEZI|nr:RmlC-like cupin domain-containing protein [Pseudomassariella vexata]ORY61033.1 RmlC-like cupin domain-containing protein [Pseudomassariella vexata]
MEIQQIHQTSANMAPSVFQLSGTCNNYPWGKQGKASLAAQLCAQTPGTDFKLDESAVYSEMWFGDYPDFPARVLSSGELLSDVLKTDKEQLLGKKVLQYYDGQLPFLPKILSISKALPLQLHPNKALATKLHEEDPGNFTDPNHKPEIAVALGKFEVFAGFKPLGEIQSLFALQPLKRFDPSPGKWDDETLRNVTRELMKAEFSTVKEVQTQLSQLSRSDLPSEAGYILNLLPRLQDQYGPEDAGSLVTLLCMNYMVFQAGDAIYIPADGIHAYLSGDIVECMARSNNVLNTGFCPPADRNSIDLFANVLTFKTHSRDDVYLPSQTYDKSKNGKTVVYKPPMSEFDMLKADLGKGETEELTANEGPGVLIVTNGEGIMKAQGEEFEMKKGYIFYVAPGVNLRWESKQALQIHMAVI